MRHPKQSPDVYNLNSMESLLNKLYRVLVSQQMLHKHLTEVYIFVLLATHQHTHHCSEVGLNSEAVDNVPEKIVIYASTNKTLQNAI